MHNPKRVPLSYYASAGILNELVNQAVKSCTAAQPQPPQPQPPQPQPPQPQPPQPEPQPEPHPSDPIISSEFQTKDWRKQQPWYKIGKSNECENYQRNQIQQITGKECPKTPLRINKRTLQMQPLSNPLTRPDGFDWTEDFDGMQTTMGHDLLYNLKMVCDAGGAQTRSLREVHSFIEAQLQLSLIQPHEKIYFINILDGDQSHIRKKQFNHLLNLPEYATVKEKVFVDDLVAFQVWYESKFAGVLNASN
jgi:hypothetical protein